MSIDMIAGPDDPFADVNYLQEIIRVIQPLALSPQTQARANELLGILIGTDLRGLRGSADEWFNLAASAARARNYTAMVKILTVGIELHPEDVDLKCEWFQFTYNHFGTAEALDAREKLEAVGTDKSATSWRYWVYNAIFEASHMGNKEQGELLLNQGLLNVPPADLLNIYRAYRTVLIDGAARPSCRSESSITDHASLVARVEKMYRNGLKLGIEAGYVLAVDLARLLRERTTDIKMANADEVLDEALHLLDIAERAYTDDGNHPLWNIYTEKAITLVARRRYEDALQIFRSLPDYQLSEPTRAMAQYAANMTGQEFKPVSTPPGPAEPSGLARRVASLEQTLGGLLAALRGGEEEPPHGP